MGKRLSGKCYRLINNGLIYRQLNVKHVVNKTAMNA